jgi:branched-chain amino acid transport system ATP-binding protein/urea transport system ATP-binding protein
VTGMLLAPIKAHCTLLIVEHDLHFIRDICDYLTVLDQGRVLDHGDVETIQRSPKVQQVFTTRV